MGNQYLMGIAFQYCKMKKFHRLTVQKCENLNATKLYI